MKKQKSFPDLLKQAQKIFNSFIRKRDAGNGCISCGAMNPEHAGHYYSAGHYSALRFSEMNCNSQCLRCNYFLSGNQIEYRKGLIHKYGEGNVKLLENTADLNKVRKWSRFELELIIKEYARADKTSW